MAFLAAGSYQAAAQEAYHIEVTLNGLKDTTCILGHYNHSSTSFVAKDTARVDASGRMVFTGTEKLPGGVYLVLLPGKSKWAEVIYSGTEPRFSLATDTTDLVGNMKVSGSVENQFFYEYQNRLRTVMKRLDSLAKLNPADPAIAPLRAEFSAYKNKAFKEHPDLLTVRFLKAAENPEIPPAPKLSNGKDDSLWVFSYYKTHYWDNFDLSDDRMLRTPLIQSKIDQYVKNLVVQVTDSLIKEADALIARTENPDVRYFLIRYFAMEYENPKTVGTEGVFVHVVENYYLKGAVDISDDARKRLKDRVDVLKPLLVNKVFPEMTVWDQQRKPLKVGTLNAELTVVFFYSPTCGHCKESAPKLLSFYEKTKDEGVKVLAVATENSDEEWKNFIKGQHFEGILNGYDYSGAIDFRTRFDVLSTPTIYILDKNKRIVARKMPVEQLEDFYSFYKRRHKL